VAVWASPATRHERLAHRTQRPLTLEEAASRDKSEIENINKGGPIALADFTIINEASLEELEKETERVLSALK
jgi:dephospho-CoA kinase